MNVSGYFHVVPDKVVGKTNIISATEASRDKYMSDVMYKLYKKQIHENINPIGTVAFLYIGGASEHHSNSRNYGKSKDSTMPVFSQMGYTASKIAKRFDGVEFMSINSNACASSMYALYEAEKLLSEYDSVIIYGEEWAEPNEVFLFKSLNIDIVCSDGLFVLCLDNRDDGVADISNTKWKWHPDKSAFGVSKEGYMTVLKDVKDTSLVKMHGTGTEANNTAEYSAIEEVLGNMETISIKEEIGHSQGVSTGLEICMMMDRLDKDDSFLALASGLGSFYGSCHVGIK